MAVTNTILATAMGGTSVLVFNKLLVDHQYSFLTVKCLSRSSCYNSQLSPQCMNGSLTATVAVCAGCDMFPSWAALLVGLVAGPVFIAADKLLLRLRIDDPVNAIPVNGVGGKENDDNNLIFMYHKICFLKVFLVCFVLHFSEEMTRGCSSIGIWRI